jgi:hypothetical protein
MNLIINFFFWPSLKFLFVPLSLKTTHFFKIKPYYLKVHKIENFFGFNFDICTISLLVMLKY